ncbi:ABC transporter ATP-binding protein [Haloferax sp. Atlit-10N]|uniref:ABC transporter ATP-binding protein n=1 Tax=Haloferax TaxID=2251 RepID=UPI000678CCBB|nr:MULTISPECIES: ABC transporter ATP-binding protein [Haloferax]RDZ40209.1 ABC transporter ATP-binding protein [Haloferax sp. Atlit-16N]RDZ51123.1 ABC transporter ATP-binding protein [Haloferax sp. Atlit-4N]RDZ56863.1 ABC transporter ATP-binding protein [Haloferax sp. Atlit-10N]
MSVIELSDVVKRYNNGDEEIAALKGVDLAVNRGEMVAIIGPSGSGKSTLLNVIGLLDTPTEGTVTLDGQDVTDLGTDGLTDHRRESIGFVFQAYHLLPIFTAVENVTVPSMWDSTVDRTDRARELLDRVGLGERLSHKPNQLSGGQQQRVAIARALVNEPHIILADEPTGNLDQDTGATILDELTRMKNEENVAIAAVTHDEQLTNYADRTVELVDGVRR